MTKRDIYSLRLGGGGVLLRLLFPCNSTFGRVFFSPSVCVTCCSVRIEDDCVAFVGLYVGKWSIREWRGVTLILAIRFKSVRQTEAATNDGGVRVRKKSVFVVNPHMA